MDKSARLRFDLEQLRHLRHFSIEKNVQFAQMRRSSPLALRNAVEVAR